MQAWFVTEREREIESMFKSQLVPNWDQLGFELHILMLLDSLTPKWGHSRGAAHELRTAALCGGQVQLEERVRENQSEFG